MAVGLVFVLPMGMQAAAVLAVSIAHVRTLGICERDRASGAPQRFSGRL